MGPFLTAAYPVRPPRVLFWAALTPTAALRVPFLAGIGLLRTRRVRSHWKNQFLAAIPHGKGLRVPVFAPEGLGRTRRVRERPFTVSKRSQCIQAFTRDRTFTPRGCNRPFT